MQLTVWTYEGPPHVGAMRIATAMEGVHYVLHAPQGDTYADLLFTMIERRSKRPPVTYTTFQARDLGSDTAELFKSAAREAYERFKPQALLVGASCTAELIQDDPGGLAEALHLPIPVIALELPAYQKKENWGASETFYRIVRTLAKAPVAKAEGPERRPRCNILGPTALGFRHRDDVTEIAKLLGQLGVVVNVTAPMGATPAEIALLPEADFNVVLYPEIALPAAQWLEKTFKQPFTKTIPIGVAATEAFVAEVRKLAQSVVPAPPPVVSAKAGTDDNLECGFTMDSRLPGNDSGGGNGTNASGFRDDGVAPDLRDDHTAASRLPWYSRSVDSTYLTGKRVFIFGDATHAIAAARVAAKELGFEVVGLGTYSREFARDVREAAKLYGVEPLITDDYLEVEEKVRAANPDLVLGTQMERHIAKRLGIPCAVISAPVHVQDFPARYSPQMGFEGANVLFDTWVHPLMMGLEEHLLGMFREDFEFHGDTAASHLGAAASSLPAKPSEKIDAAPAMEAELAWGPDAEKELRKIPFFVRGKARRNTESYAAHNGITHITVETLYDAKAHFGR